MNLSVLYVMRYLLLGVLLLIAAYLVLATVLGKNKRS
jgi:hypothetical protein